MRGERLKAGLLLMDEIGGKEGSMNELLVVTENKLKHIENYTFYVPMIDMLLRYNVVII